MNETLLKSQFQQAIAQMEQRGFQFLPGLTDQEIDTVQVQWQLRFPPDLRMFLQLALPAPLLGHHIEHKAFPNWRSEDNDDHLYIQYRLNWPEDMLLWDVEYHAYWNETWGKRPGDTEAARNIARQAYANAPRLIPIYGHHFIPAEPEEVGNPVFSMHGHDTIIYGSNLLDYLAHEFRLQLDYQATASKVIAFWSQLAG